MTKRRKVFLLGAATLILLASTLFLGFSRAEAADYCVAPSGTDSSGTSGLYPSNCWKTFNYAAPRVAPGDSVCAFAGDYAGIRLQNSGTSGNRITWGLCSGVTNGEVTIVSPGSGTKFINVDSGVSYNTIEDFHFGQELWDGVDYGGYYENGNSDSNIVRRVKFLGDYKSLQELNSRFSQYGTNQVFRVCGNGALLEEVEADFWYGNGFGICSSNTDRYNWTLRNSKLTNIRHHVTSAPKSCHGQNVNYRGLFEGNILGPSGVSDCFQADQDDDSENPNTSRVGPRMAPCIHNIVFRKNLCLGAAENVYDRKGQGDILIEQGVFVGALTDDDGPLIEGAKDTGGGTINTGASTTTVHTIIRNNVFLDTAGGIGNNMTASHAAYGNLWVNARRNTFGPNQDREGSRKTCVQGNWGGPGIVVNNACVTIGMGMSSGDPDYAGFFDYNLYHDSTPAYFESDAVEFDTLADWRAYSGHGQNSIAVGLDKVFVNPTGLETINIGEDDRAWYPASAYLPLVEQWLAENRFQMLSTIDPGGANYNRLTGGSDPIRVDGAHSSGVTTIELKDVVSGVSRMNGAHMIWGKYDQNDNFQRDTVEIDGNEYQVTAVNQHWVNGVEQSDGSIEISPGLVSGISDDTPVRIVYSDGSDSRQIGPPPIYYGLDGEAPPPASGDYCVATDGDDGNDGEAPDCWLSAQHAADTVAAGATVCFEDGNYAGFTVSTSGTLANPIQWGLCAGASRDNVSFFQEASEVSGARQTASGTIELTTGTSYNEFRAFTLHKTMYGSGKHGIYGAGGNTGTVIDDVRFIGDVRDGATLRADSQAAPRDGQSTKTQDHIVGINGGTDVKVSNVYVRYWPDKGIVADSVRGRYQYNDIAHTSGSAISLGSSCNGQAEYLTGNVFYRNNVGLSYSGSGFSQFADASAPGGVGPDGMNPMPCRGGDTFSENTVYGISAAPFKLIGGLRHVIENNKIIGNANNPNGRASGVGATCLSIVSDAAPSGFTKDLLIRGNLMADTAAGLDNSIGYSAYNNSLIYTTRTLESVGSAGCANQGFSSRYATHVKLRNNFVFTPGRTLAFGAADVVDSDYNLLGTGATYLDTDTDITYSTLPEWEAAITGWTYAGKEANSVELGSADSILAETGMGSYSFGLPETAITLAAVEAQLPNYVHSALYEATGGPLATVKQSTTGTTINVGEDWRSFCCSFNRAEGWGTYDSVSINGTVYELAGVDPAAQTVTLSTSGTFSVGDAIQVVYPSGRTSQQQGAHEFWAKSPQVTLPKWQVDASNRDGEENASGVMNITNPSVSIGATTGSGDQQTIRVYVTNPVHDADQADGGSYNGSGSYFQVYSKNVWMQMENLGIPANATIDSWSLSMRAHWSNSSTRDVTMSVQSGCEAPLPTPGTDAIVNLSRLPTTEEVNYTPMTSTVVVTKALDPAVLQQAVDQSCWDETADLGIIFDDEGGTSFTFSSCDYSSCAFASYVDITYTPEETSAAEAAILVDAGTDVVLSDTVANAMLVLTPYATRGNAFDITVEGLLAPVADLTTTDDDITNRVARTTAVTCSNVSPWTVDIPVGLTESRCPGLTALMQALVDDADFDGVFGFVLSTAEADVQIYSWDGDPPLAAGVNVDVEDLEPPTITVGTPQQVCYSGAVCTNTVTAVDFEATACSTVTPDYTALPGGHDAALSAPSALPDCESTFTWTPQSADAGAMYTVGFTATAANSVEAQSQADIAVFNPLTGTGVFPVTQTACDALEYQNDGTVTLGSDTLWMDLSPVAGDYTAAGVCFDHVAPAQGAIITDAYIQFSSKAIDAGDTYLEVECEASDDAPVFTAADNDITGRATTGVVVPWAVPAWTVLDERGVNQRTPQLRDALQPVFIRPGWLTGGRIACTIQTDRQIEPQNNAHYKAAHSIDTATLNAEPAALHLQWKQPVALPSTGVTTPGGTTSENVIDGETDTDETGVGVKEP